MSAHLVDLIRDRRILVRLVCDPGHAALRLLRRRDGRVVGTVVAVLLMLDAAGCAERMTSSIDPIAALFSVGLGMALMVLWLIALGQRRSPWRDRLAACAPACLPLQMSIVIAAAVGVHGWWGRLAVAVVLAIGCAWTGVIAGCSWMVIARRARRHRVRCALALIGCVLGTWAAAAWAWHATWSIDNAEPWTRTSIGGVEYVVGWIGDVDPAIASGTAAAFAAVDAYLGERIAGSPPRVYLVADADEIECAIGQSAIAGYAPTLDALLVRAAPWSEVGNDVAHEYCHAWTTHRYRAGLPSFLSEGMAVDAEVAVAAKVGAHPDWALHGDAAVDLAAFTSSTAFYACHDAYPIAGALVSHLLGDFGRARFERFCERCAAYTANDDAIDGDAVRTAFRRTYDIDFDGYVRALDDGVDARSRPPRPRRTHHPVRDHR